MLLIGMNTSLITYPMTPITANPIAHEEAILTNSSKFRLVKIYLKFGRNKFL